MAVDDALATATAVVDRHAPSAPDAVRADAARLLAAILESNPTRRHVSFGDQAVTLAPNRHRDALEDSGAARILAPWRQPRARRLETETT